tara:strand:- start:225 stop:341 length:117 start_codon:yes stop_codon:yes gene_type:complete
MNQPELSNKAIKKILIEMFKAEQSIMAFRALQIGGYEN